MQGRAITGLCLDKRLLAIAWEEMFEGSRHVFWQNNVIAGQASLIDAMRFMGRTYDGLIVAVIGKGNTARGALNVLHKFSTRITGFQERKRPLPSGQGVKVPVVPRHVLSST